MANAVFTTKAHPTYDDLPESRYHFPKIYLKTAEQALGDWIVYYEPRREGAADSGRAGPPTSSNFGGQYPSGQTRSISRAAFARLTVRPTRASSVATCGSFPRASFLR